MYNAVCKRYRDIMSGRVQGRNRPALQTVHRSQRMWTYQLTKKWRQFYFINKRRYVPGQIWAKCGVSFMIANVTIVNIGFDFSGEKHKPSIFIHHLTTERNLCSWTTLPWLINQKQMLTFGLLAASLKEIKLLQVVDFTCQRDLVFWNVVTFLIIFKRSLHCKTKR